MENCPNCGALCTISWSGLDLVENTGDETLATKNYHNVSNDLEKSLLNKELTRLREALRVKNQALVVAKKYVHEGYDMLSDTSLKFRTEFSDAIKQIDSALQPQK
jgi:hypothetical protein